MAARQSLYWEKYENLNTTPEHISRFLTKSRHGSIFQNPQWYTHTEEKTDRYMVIAAVRQGEPVFASLIRKRGVPGSNSYMGTIERGPVFDDVQLAVALWDAFETQLTLSGLCAIEIHPFWERSAVQQLRSFLQNHDYMFSPPNSHLETLTLDLTPSQADIFNTFKSSRRNLIRKAVKLGVYVQPAQNSMEMDRFWEMYRDMCLSKGIHFWSRKRFESIRRYSQSFPNECACLLGWLNGDLVGGNIILRHSDIAEVTRGGGSTKIPNSIPKTDLILWESILWAKRVGATTYDFGGFKGNAEEGSPEQGINRFKLEFTQNHVELMEPMEKIFNATAYRVFNSLKKVKKSLLKCIPIRLQN